jgi:hypothetical protein
MLPYTVTLKPCDGEKTKQQFFEHTLVARDER